MVSPFRSETKKIEQDCQKRKMIQKLRAFAQTKWNLPSFSFFSSFSLFYLRGFSDLAKKKHRPPREQFQSLKTPLHARNRHALLFLLAVRPCSLSNQRFYLRAEESLITFPLTIKVWQGIPRAFQERKKRGIILWRRRQTLSSTFMRLNFWVE